MSELYTGQFSIICWHSDWAFYIRVCVCVYVRINWISRRVAMCILKSFGSIHRILPRSCLEQTQTEQKRTKRGKKKILLCVLLYYRPLWIWHRFCWDCNPIGPFGRNGQVTKYYRITRHFPIDFQSSFRAVSGQFQGSFRPVSGQFQGSFRAVSGQFQGSFRTVSGQFQDSFRAVSAISISVWYRSSFSAILEQFQGSKRYSLSVTFVWYQGNFRAV